MTIRNLLLGILIIASFAVGFLVGRFSSIGNTYIENKSPSSMNTSNQPDLDDATTTSNETAVSTAGLTPDQIKMLSALGIDTNKVTPTMIACAEASLGASRTQEIKNGDSPSFTEGIKLMACYK